MPYLINKVKLFIKRYSYPKVLSHFVQLGTSAFSIVAALFPRLFWMLAVELGFSPCLLPKLGQKK